MLVVLMPLVLVVSASCDSYGNGVSRGGSYSAIVARGSVGNGASSNVYCGSNSNVDGGLALSALAG